MRGGHPKTTPGHCAELSREADEMTGHHPQALLPPKSDVCYWSSSWEPAEDREVVVWFMGKHLWSCCVTSDKLLLLSGHQVSHL